MKSTSLTIKASLIASLLVSSQAFSKNLPDEINHPYYQRLYQNLQQVLSQKIADYERLSAEKAELVRIISMMEKDQEAIPQRNNEIQRLIEDKRQEITRIDAEIQGLESVLGRIIDDLRRIDNMIAQLQRDLNEESSRARQIEGRRHQIAQDVGKINARLEREIREEQQSVQTLNRMTGEMNGSQERLREVQVERSQLVRDADRFKAEIPDVRRRVTENTNALGVKRPELTKSEAELPGIQAELKAQEAQLSQIDTTLNPKKAELSRLKAELARRTPEIGRLETEIKTLTQKISTSETRISSLNVEAKIQRRDALESQISGVKNQIKQNNDAKVALEEKIKPVIGQINGLMIKWREAVRRRDRPEADRLKKEMDALNATIASDQREIMRLQQESDRLALSIAARQNEINQLNAAITASQVEINNLQKDIETSRIKITENKRRIAELSAANSDLTQKISELQKEVDALEGQRQPLAGKVTQLKQKESELSAKISSLKNEIQRLQAQTNTLNARLTEMETVIREFPDRMRRLDAHIRSLNEKIRELSFQADRERRLLSRIQQDRMAIQSERDRAQAALDEVSRDLVESNRLISVIQNKLREENANRDALTRYNQDSIRKFDELKRQKAQNTDEIAAASEELRINEQDLATIARELPRFRSELQALGPKVVAAENEKNTAEKNVSDASFQYQERLSLYQNYLSQAQGLGSDKASIGQADGAKAGALEARAKAGKLAAENAASEGKWQALRRGYIRGEIEGFRVGFDLGLSSSSDARRGTEEGRIAGEKRARDYANMVVKPEKYLAELDRRLREDSTTDGAPFIAALMADELPSIRSMARELNNSIPELSAQEIEESLRIVTSLDAQIAQSEIEIEEVFTLRRNLSRPQNVYSTPGPGENANNVNCSAVYKGVKDFVDACKGAYVLRYQSLYNSTHQEAFNKFYPDAFSAQIRAVLESELSRLYPVYLEEAIKISRQVGITSGKKEIYQQSFDRTESMAYGGTLPVEVSRVESEAVQLVQEHLNQNAALTLKGSARLSTSNIFGISPGAEVDLKMLIKNIGSVSSSGNSIVKITEVSSALSPERREAPLASVEANSHSDLSVIKLKVNDAARPGTNVVLAGEIVHPGHHYRSSRIETFRLETVLGVNPSIESSVDLDKDPNISGLFGIAKKHDIDIKITPKHEGVELGYEATLEEVDSQFLDIVSTPSVTERLGRGQEKKIRFSYKLSKASRGKTISLRLKIKNDGKIVSQHDLIISPK